MMPPHRSSGAEPNQNLNVVLLMANEMNVKGKEKKRKSE
jgi:hypothetical protein